MNELPERLVLFDGVCGFCDRAVVWLMARDPASALHFAPLQGRAAETLRARHPEIPGETETFVYVDASGGSERVFLRSEAVFRVCGELEGPWRKLALLGRLPRWLRDPPYRLFVRMRYRVFGRLDACRVPSPEERDRFLD